MNHWSQHGSWYYTPIRKIHVGEQHLDLFLLVKYSQEKRGLWQFKGVIPFPIRYPNTTLKRSMYNVVEFTLLVKGNDIYVEELRGIPPSMRNLEGTRSFRGLARHALAKAVRFALEFHPNLITIRLLPASSDPNLVSNNNLRAMYARSFGFKSNGLHMHTTIKKFLDTYFVK